MKSCGRHAYKQVAAPPGESNKQTAKSISKVPFPVTKSTKPNSQLKTEMHGAHWTFHLQYQPHNQKQRKHAIDES